jgi:hypothetical protein
MQKEKLKECLKLMPTAIKIVLFIADDQKDILYKPVERYSESPHVKHGVGFVEQLAGAGLQLLVILLTVIIITRALGLDVLSQQVDQLKKGGEVVMVRVSPPIH